MRQLAVVMKVMAMCVVWISGVGQVCSGGGREGGGRWKLSFGASCAGGDTAGQGVFGYGRGVEGVWWWYVSLGCHSYSFAARV